MLMEELNTIKQQMQESVLSFHNNIEQIYTHIINSIPANYSDIRGRSETLRELALQRFIFYSKPDISRFLRSKDISTLPDALNAALDEERALNMTKNHFPKTKKYCSHCKHDTHNTAECFKKSSVQFNNPISNSNNRNEVSNFWSSSNNASQKTNWSHKTKTCNYCKKQGHTISECRKREYNNSRKNRASVQINTQENSLNTWESAENTVTADWE
ncbi:hypothetical protein HHI36_006800 [Cryptolaemus montrouzieri]|uniref:Gag protein n=1 Tax=Cryptolaemus montrouzieri TaxID=559131 RepID=A0ABD2NZ78_9CUCU